MSILAHDTDPAVCLYDCTHPACIAVLADLWANAVQPLTAPF